MKGPHASVHGTICVCESISDLCTYILHIYLIYMDICSVLAYKQLIMVRDENFLLPMLQFLKAGFLCIML